KPRHLKSERLSGLEIDDEVKLRRSDHGQIARLGALENPSGVNAGLAIAVANVRSVAHRATSQNKLATKVNRRNFVTRGEGDKLFTAAKEEWSGRAPDDRFHQCTYYPIANDFGPGSGREGVWGEVTRCFFAPMHSS